MPEKAGNSHISPLEGAAEILGVVDPRERSVVERLAYRHHRKNTLLLSSGDIKSDLETNKEVIDELEAVLNSFGRNDLVEGLEKLAVKDYSNALHRR